MMKIDNKYYFLDMEMYPVNIFELYISNWTKTINTCGNVQRRKSITQMISGMRKFMLVMIPSNISWNIY